MWVSNQHAGHVAVVCVIPWTVAGYGTKLQVVCGDSGIDVCGIQPPQRQMLEKSRQVLESHSKWHSYWLEDARQHTPLTWILGSSLELVCRDVSQVRLSLG